MNSVNALLLLISMSAFAEDGSYCEKGERIEKMKEGFDVRFCFGTEEYMEAFARKLDDEGIPHHVYKNGDIGYKSSYRNRVQKIGDSLLYEYIFTENGSIREDL